MSNFQCRPEIPVSGVLLGSYHLLVNTHTVCNDFLILFDDLITNQAETREATGRELDLLRASLLFASSGIDSFMKRLIRDALYEVVQRSEGAELRLKQYIENKISRNDGASVKWLSDALIARDSRKHSVDSLIYDLTGKSLQSKDELLNIASYFDIPSNSIVTDFGYLKEIFDIRNQIAHEMDFDHNTNRRRVRSQDEIVKAVEYIFQVATNILREVDSKISA